VGQVKESGLNMLPTLEELGSKINPFLFTQTDCLQLPMKNKGFKPYKIAMLDQS
jgi:hypothetical protein